MSIQAMKLAMEALEFDGFTPADPTHRHLVLSARSTLSAALSQQPATPEPVAWVVMNGVSKYQVCGAKAPADALCSEMQKRHDLSGSLSAFHVRPLYTHPAPSVPGDVVRDAERWRTFLATRPSNTHEGIIAAIDAAVLAAKETK